MDTSTLEDPFFVTSTVFLLYSIHPKIMKKNKNSELKAGKRTACALSLVVKLYVRNVHIKLDYQSKGTSLILHDNRWWGSSGFPWSNPWWLFLVHFLKTRKHPNLTSKQVTNKHRSIQLFAATLGCLNKQIWY